MEEVFILTSQDLELVIDGCIKEYCKGKHRGIASAMLVEVPLMLTIGALAAWLLKRKKEQ